jgi:hypothetical protein
MLGLIYTFIGGDSTKQLRKGVITFLLTVIIGSIVLYGFIKIKETIKEPTYELTKYFSKWDWKTEQTLFVIDKENFKMSVYEGQVKELPTPFKLNKLIDECIEDSKLKNKLIKLNTISISIDYENVFPKMIKTLYIKLEYESSEGKSDWVWDGEKYVEKKIKGFIETTYKYDLLNLQK